MSEPTPAKTLPIMQTRAVRVAGHPTSLRLEPIFWDLLTKMALNQGQTLAQCLTALDAARPPEQNLASFVRVSVVQDLLKP
jgi:predicted DNA-binding ribbon-helix-helix protein